MNDECKYKFTLDGKEAEAKELSHGAYAISLGASGEHEIIVREARKA